MHAPEAGAVEEVFHAVNTKSALKLAHVRGVALLVLAEAGILYGEYSPLTIKKSVVGHGRAEKEQVQFMMRAILGARHRWNSRMPAMRWRWRFAM